MTHASSEDSRPQLDSADAEASAQTEALGQVYAELRRIAAGYLRAERSGHTLAPTALVHEAWTRLNSRADSQGPSEFEDQGHFLRLAARAMRRVLVDHARARGRIKRGGPEARRIELETGGWVAPEPTGGVAARRLDLLALDEALQKLADLDPDLARLVELRWFAGLTIEETARALSTSTAGVERSWRVARLWLLRELDPEASGGTP